MRIFLLLLLCIISMQISTAQESLNSDLSYYGDIMVNAYEPKHRTRAKIEFEKLLLTYLTERKFKSDNWQSVQAYTRIQKSSNKEVIIVTYQVDEGAYPYSYGGYVITDNQVIELNQQSDLNTDSEYQTYTDADWYGALYYNMLPIKGQKNSYLLFGYQYSQEFDKTKLIDIITVGDDGVTFGKELFITRVQDGRDDIKQRFLLQYSSDSNASLNYNDSIDMIIFDHLMPRMGQQAGQGNTFVPDGTYEGYHFQDGSFVYVDKIFDHIYESAPRPEPVLNSSKSNKDILGRDKN